MYIALLRRMSLAKARWSDCFTSSFVRKYIHAHNYTLPVCVCVFVRALLYAAWLYVVRSFLVCSPERWRIRRLVWDYQWVNPLLLLTTQRWLTNTAYIHTLACVLTQKQHSARHHTRRRAESCSSKSVHACEICCLIWLYIHILCMPVGV